MDVAMTELLWLPLADDTERVPRCRPAGACTAGEMALQAHLTCGDESEPTCVGQSDRAQATGVRPRRLDRRATSLGFVLR